MLPSPTPDSYRIVSTIGMTPYRARITEAGNARIREKIAAQRETDRQAKRLETEATVRRKRLDETLAATAKAVGPHFATLILRDVAEKHKFTVDDLKGTSRKAPVVRARQEAMWRIHTECRLSLPKIGQRLGSKDHTTVLHGIRQHVRRKASEEART